MERPAEYLAESSAESLADCEQVVVCDKTQEQICEEKASYLPHDQSRQVKVACQASFHQKNQHVWGDN